MGENISMASLYKKTKSNGGRPSKLTDKLISDICGYLRVGAYVETAYMACGISKENFAVWCKLGNKRPKSIYARFLSEVSIAMEQATLRDLVNIDKCAMGQEPEYERHPEGTFDDNGRDISGHVMLNARGNPIIKRIGLAPEWQASAWRLERRKYNQWGKMTTIKDDREKEDDRTVIILPEKDI